MADVEIEIDDLTVPELLASGERLADGLTNNEHFPEPNPPVAELRAIIGELTVAQEEYRRQRLRLNDLQTACDVSAKKLKEAIVAGASYVQEASEGDAAKIISANLHFEHRRSLWPFGGLDQVNELSSSAGDQRGEIDLSWDPVHGAAGYEVELSRDISPYGPWEPAAATAQSRTTLEQLTSYQRYWFRVRAVSEDATGEWSDPVTKSAP